MAILGDVVTGAVRRLSTWVLALAIALISVPPVHAMVPRSLVDPLLAAGPLLAAPVPCSPDFIHVYMRTKQPVESWSARVVGTDLKVLVGNVGWVDLVITDAEGTREVSKPWDRNTPFEAALTLHGPSPTIVATVLSQDRTRVGCTHTFRLTHRA